jgi:hypothetical protein
MMMLLIRENNRWISCLMMNLVLRVDNQIKNRLLEHKVEVKVDKKMDRKNQYKFIAVECYTA